MFAFFGQFRDALKDVLMIVNGNKTPKKAGDGLPLMAKSKIAGMVA